MEKFKEMGGDGKNGAYQISHDEIRDLADNGVKLTPPDLAPSASDANPRAS